MSLSKSETHRFAWGKIGWNRVIAQALSPRIRARVCFNTKDTNPQIPGAGGHEETLVTFVPFVVNLKGAKNVQST